MATVDMYNMEGRVVGSCELPDGLFAAEVNEAAVHTAVVTYLANQRQGTQSAKTRAEVRGGGAKPRPQKGTGRARQGSIRSPQWRGGGIVFAPKPRDHSVKINKKVRRLALKSVLTDKLNGANVIVVDSLNLSEPKTKVMAKVLSNLKAEKALVVMPESGGNVARSSRNIPDVKASTVGTLNVFDILKYEKFIVTKDAVEKMREVYA